MINCRKQTCWMTRSRDLGNAENTHCRSLPIQIKKGGCAAAKSLLGAAARLLWFNGYLHKFMAVELRCVCMHNRNPRKNMTEEKGNLVNAANIGTACFICYFYYMLVTC